MHGNVCVVTQTGNENWSLELWHEALDDCSREFISLNIMVEFVGHWIDCETGGKNEFSPIYSALILSNGLEYDEVVDLISKRVSKHLPGTACFVRWMDQKQRDSQFMVRQFYVHEDRIRWFDRRTGESLSRYRLNTLVDQGFENELCQVDEADVVDWSQSLFDIDHSDEIYRTLEMYFPQLEYREENLYCHPRNLHTTGFTRMNEKRDFNQPDGFWIDGIFYEDVFCNNLSVWGIPKEVIGFDDMSHFDLEYDEIKRVYDDKGRLAKYLPI